MERGFLGLLLNYGDMKIDSAGTGSEQEFEWVNIDKPNDLKNLIEKARNPAAYNQTNQINQIPNQQVAPQQPPVQ